MEDNEKQSYDQDNQDDFGLPEIEYEPLDREDDTPPEFEDDTYYDKEVEEEETDNSKKKLIIISLISILIIAGICLYLFVFGGMDQISSWFKDKPQPQPVTDLVAEPESEPEPEPEPEPDPVPEVDPLAPYSDITAISEPIGRSFIVVGSFIDDDLAMDYSQELLAQDVGSRILAPTDRAPLMHRVAVADYENFQQAMNEISLFRNKYGEQTWVLKY